MGLPRTVAVRRRRSVGSRQEATGNKPGKTPGKLQVKGEMEVGLDEAARMRNRVLTGKQGRRNSKHGGKEV